MSSSGFSIYIPTPGELVTSPCNRYQGERLHMPKGWGYVRQLADETEARRLIDTARQDNPELECELFPYGEWPDGAAFKIGEQVMIFRTAGAYHVLTRSLFDLPFEDLRRQMGR